MRLRWHAFRLVAGALALTACGGAPPPPAPAPENLAALEAELARDPSDAALMIRVGIASYHAQKYERARDVLRGATTVAPRHYAAHVYLGLAYEELNRLDSARTAYTAAAGLTTDRRQQGDIQGRLLLLTRKELKQAAQAAIAQEAALATQPPVENSFAVFPFRYVGTNAELEPVGRGLTHLMVTDLAKLSQLRLLEREQVQALVDEMALTGAGQVDPATGARSGRMLRAARVIQGSVQDQPGDANLRLDAAVVDAGDASVVASGSGSDQLRQLFALQKQVLFRLVDQLGLVLTPAERRALTERPTADLQAFLAFSRGLQQEDQGDFAGAAASYGAALARDPNFRAARDRQQTSQQLSAATTTSETQLAGVSPGGDVGGVDERTTEAPPASDAGRTSVLRSGVLYTVPSVGSTLTNRLGSTSPVSRQPSVRPALPETLGSDTPGGGLSGTIIIIITRP